MLSTFIFGEVLFDHFPEKQVLGGAPFNVAWHLQGFGDEPLFISRVGDDARGREVRELMTAWGLDQRGLQTDPDHSTGVVEVSLTQGQPSYEIKANQAYDFVEMAPVLAITKELGPPQLFYHGSLALRHITNQSIWQELRAHTPAEIFVDLNLRRPWWNRELWPQLLNSCRYLKLNHEELAILAGRDLSAQDDLAEAALQLIAQYKIEQVWVTRAEEGALVQPKDAEYAWVPAQPVGEMQDTVGAGDAFSAVVLHGLLQGWQTKDLLRRAVSFAAELCGYRGALLHDKTVYMEYKRRWGEEDAIGD
jgi:fructokinase